MEKKLTLQECFDKVWDWFVVHGKPASLKEGTIECLYRGPNGTKCAAGVLMPDDIYDPRCEDTTINCEKNGNTGWRWDSIPELEAWRLSLPLVHVQKLQWIHDSASSLEGTSFTNRITKKLRAFAKDNGLEVQTAGGI